MTDVGLLSFGCVVMFIAYAGAYVAIRENLFSRGRPAADPNEGAETTREVRSDEIPATRASS